MKEWLRESLLAVLRPIVSRARASRVQLDALGQCVVAEAFGLDRKSPGHGLESGGKIGQHSAPSSVPVKADRAYVAVALWARFNRLNVFTFAQTSCLCEFEPHSETLQRGCPAGSTARFSRWRARTLDIDVILAGTSAALRNIEIQIEKIGAATYPVVIEGEFGARSGGYPGRYPSRKPSRRPALCLARFGLLQSGSFFRRNRNCPSGGERRNALSGRRGPSGSQTAARPAALAEAGETRGFAALAGAANRLHPAIVESLSSEGSFCRFLKTELDYLRVRLPPLRDRREDIPMLLKELLHAGLP